MRNLFGLLVLVIIGFTSCEGRRTHGQSLAESVKEFKANTIIEKVNYIPSEYNEIVTDTMLSNGFRVKISTFSDMKNSVPIVSKLDNVVKKKNYRQHIGEIEIFYNEKLITRTNIKKSFFFDEEDHEFSDSSILKAVNLNFISSLKDKLLINITYCIPESSDCKDFILSIDSSGNYMVDNVSFRKY